MFDTVTVFVKPGSASETFVFVGVDAHVVAAGPLETLLEMFGVVREFGFDVGEWS